MAVEGASSDSRDDEPVAQTAARDTRNPASENPCRGWGTATQHCSDAGCCPSSRNDGVQHASAAPAQVVDHTWPGATSAMVDVGSTRVVVHRMLTRWASQSTVTTSSSATAGHGADDAATIRKACRKNPPTAGSCLPSVAPRLMAKSTSCAVPEMASRCWKQCPSNWPLRNLSAELGQEIGTRVQLQWRLQLPRRYQCGDSDGESTLCVV